MKFFRRVSIWLVLISILFILGLEVFITTKGKGLLEVRLQEVLHRPVKIGAAYYIFPSKLFLQTVEIEGVLQAKMVDVVFELDSLWEGPVIINEFIVRRPSFDVLVVGKSFHFLGGILQGKGWFDWAKRNMKADFVLKDLEKKDVLILDLRSQNNNMNISGKIDLQHLAEGIFKTQKAGLINSTLVSNISENDVLPMTQFSFQTKMDQPQLENISFSGKVIIP